MKTKNSILIVFAFLSAILYNEKALGCTRIVYQGLNGTILTARSMDWRGEIPANLWVFPRGMERFGEAGNNSVKWKSKYGSVVTSSWDIASSDGMNEKGLVGNLLWLAESTYPQFEKNSKTKGLAVSLWLQYVLDNFATVSEVVNALGKNDFTVTSSHIPGTDIFATIHLSISDSSGDNAIFEYINGKLVIHHDRSYVAMTNSPIFDEQLAINTYWKSIPGTIMLPGTNRAADRFVRAHYYIDAIPKTDNIRTALSSVFGVIRNCSVPLGISSATEPNISSTRWRTVADQKNLVYYFDNVLNPNVVWVEFSKLDFSEKAKVRKLSLANNENYSGESSMNFQAMAPFKFAGLD
ncbi:linear amide C-N hydrolase [Flavobacterium sp. KACC 22761]|uniref:linear amide C-N hydrolase n=1 Tax=Flavobacterium sp. KACC 22761 TaxID=3092665 RepID=UPI002A750D15|nr:linear amide C-N hydrolase [Flavobacterium sp. KACC 22761]WPO78050.1 linear amide C-N hydrolase [Flavobacterium sp. KACC 22761]